MLLLKDRLPSHPRREQFVDLLLPLPNFEDHTSVLLCLEETWYEEWLAEPHVPRTRLDFDERTEPWRHDLDVFELLVPLPDAVECPFCIEEGVAVLGEVLGRRAPA